MELNPNETELFNLLKSGETISLDHLEATMGVGRKALVVRLKYLAAKIATDGYVVERCSGVGRGARASYKMEKKF